MNELKEHITMFETMKWYWKIGGGHTHVRVFVNGAKCGDLCFRNDEFYRIRHSVSGVTFVDENPPAVPQTREHDALDRAM